METLCLRYFWAIVWSFEELKGATFERNEDKADFPGREASTPKVVSFI